MRKQLQYDFSVWFQRDKMSKMFLIDCVIIIVFACFSFAGTSTLGYGSIYDFHILLNDRYNVVTALLYILIPILACLPHADVGYEEDTLKLAVVIRSNRIIYYTSRLFVVFLSGFLHILFILEFLYVLQLAAINLQTSFVYVENYSLLFFVPDMTMAFSQLLYNHPIVYAQFYFVMVSCFAGSIAVLSYVLAEYMYNRMVACISGFVVSIVFSVVFQFLFGLRLSYFMVFLPKFGLYTWEVIIGMLFWVVGILIIAIVLQWMYVKRIEDD